MSPEPDKWEIQLRKGGLELAILAALWEGRRYGLEILKILDEGSDLVITEGTIYPLLSRLKSVGWVESEWVESGAGHPRKYYWLTASGQARALEMARAWKRFAGSMGGLIEPLMRGGESDER